jgi:hypothetical protein
MIMFSRLVFSGRCKIADEISLTLPPRMHIGSVSHWKRRLLMSLIIELPIRSVPLGFRTSLFPVGVLVIAHDENLYFVYNDSCCRMKNKSINMRLYHKDGVHLNLSGSYKLAENIGITCVSYLFFVVSLS